MSLSIGAKTTIAVLSVGAIHPDIILEQLPSIPEEDLPTEENELLQQICRAILADDPETFNTAMAKLEEIAERE